MYTIGEVSKMFDLSISTLRFYDKVGLLRNVKRKNGIRQFDDNDVEVLLLIECLKNSGMQIKDIKIFLDWCAEGDATLSKRYEMFQKQREKILNEIEKLKDTLDLINFKCWYYQEAVKNETDKNLKNLDVSKMPEKIRECYQKSHKCIKNNKNAKF